MNNVENVKHDGIAGGILAGGQSSRMGEDKVKSLLNGKPLIEHVIGRLIPQVDEIIINPYLGWDKKIYSEYQHVFDKKQGQQGPLNGINALLEYVQGLGYEFLVVVPCDAPLLPKDLVTKMLLQAQDERVPLAMAQTSNSIQPTFSLWHTSVVPIIEEQVNSGQGSLKKMLDLCPHTLVHWPDDQALCFSNINTPDDLENL